MPVAIVPTRSELAEDSAALLMIAPGSVSHTPLIAGVPAGRTPGMSAQGSGARVPSVDSLTGPHPAAVTVTPMATDASLPTHPAAGTIGAMTNVVVMIAEVPRGSADRTHAVLAEIPTVGLKTVDPTTVGWVHPAPTVPAMTGTDQVTAGVRPTAAPTTATAPVSSAPSGVRNQPACKSTTRVTCVVQTARTVNAHPKSMRE
ncbi:hypothetical protein [Psychromicrobium xiongbiense]|uniref:hypothetical protein n=1 Tax=Psychromicrobium xiongbiense TaxID=3051184 RepID=UPI002555FCA6|nr:hypothetical protein [Psychromicrobium sp. YIM S02556]